MDAEWVSASAPSKLVFGNHCSNYRRVDMPDTSLVGASISVMDDPKHTEPIQAEPKPHVGIGMHVTVEIRGKVGNSERLEFDVVPDAQADFAAGLVSERAPLALAIKGHTLGEIVEYHPPSGVDQTVLILSIEPSRSQSEQPAPDRNEVLEQVMDKIARRESKQIALTAELHYGSIDPDGIKEE